MTHKISTVYQELINDLRSDVFIYGSGLTVNERMDALDIFDYLPSVLSKQPGKLQAHVIREKETLLAKLIRIAAVDAYELSGRLPDVRQVTRLYNFYNIIRTAAYKADNN